MTKAEMITALAEKTGVSKKAVEQVLGGLADLVIEEMKSGQSVPLTGLGVFAVAERAARTGRNPRTGETIQIAASKSISFKPGKAAKDALN